MGATCRGAACACPPGASDACGGQCVNQQADPRNCGGCGTVCGAGCRSGACLVVKELALGGQHTLARLGDGSVVGWGYNGFGQLGDGTTKSHAGPTALPGLTTVLDLSAGSAHSCAVLTDGTVRCWGDNAYGQLGDEAALSSPVPLVIAGLSGDAGLSAAVEAAAGGRHTCARIQDGSVSCWGWNANGQIGDGTKTAFHLLPGAATGLVNAAEIASGASHSCARTTDGSVSCWGWNAAGQLGDGTTTARSRPAPVPSLSGVSRIAAGGDRTCAVLADGSVDCWGGAPLGDGGAGPLGVPTPVEALAGAVEVAVGSAHACARLKDGTVSCWGDNGHGQLGDGQAAARPAAAPAKGVAGAVEIAAGGDHTCARLGDGSILCWGANGQGQVGDGTTTDRPTPTRVRWP
jgi:alpha-tubulin suppressor-like RCC1 family protein